MKDYIAYGKACHTANKAKKVNCITEFVQEMIPDTAGLPHMIYITTGWHLAEGLQNGQWCCPKGLWLTLWPLSAQEDLYTV